MAVMKSHWQSRGWEWQECWTIDSKEDYIILLFGNRSPS
jgi:hypothetical protein